ncbi:MAG TPA: ATP-dependent DNA ligase [Galbitalea sp.]|jgi:ATP-dependent DNA ligase|nr:ATP-dependent DNA ligase [Galbitalea sp.]
MNELIEPMLAKLTDAVPLPDEVAGGLLYEPKWDGFRGIVYFDGTDVEIGSRGSKLLTRYFPELVEMFTQQLPNPCVLDGEIVVRRGRAGGERLDWETLSQRIHPAVSRVAKLSAETPASFVAFDLLSIDGKSLLEAPFAQRRAALEKLLAKAKPPLHLTQTSTDPAVANRWLEEFEGAGLDGVVAKPLAAAYGPGKRVMFKTKHDRTADVVLLGYRIHKSGAGVGSLLLGLYGSDGELGNVGGASAFSDARRLELVEELAPLVKRDESGEIVKGATDRSRFSGSKDVSFVALEPTRVLEVKYDQMEGPRFRHTVQFVRWRPERDARSCTFEQLERPIAYDLGDVFA